MDNTGTTFTKEFNYTGVPHHSPLLAVWESIRLWHRANKYAWQEDSGGIQYLRSAIQPGDTVFDIGAHKAGYLYHILQSVGATGTIVAFEPQQHLFLYLQHLQQLLRWNQVRLERKAVSDYTGTAMLLIPFNGGQCSSPCATIIQSREKFSIRTTEPVSTITLDEYCQRHQLVPSFLKVDTEGSESAVFMGAAQLLKRYKPRLLFECESRFIGTDAMEMVFTQLQGYGYTGYFIQNRELIPLKKFNPAQHQQKGKTPYCNNFIFE